MTVRYDTYTTENAAVGVVTVDGEPVKRNNYPFGPNSRQQAERKARNWARDEAREYDPDTDAEDDA